jgi:hypothetical protein
MTAATSKVRFMADNYAALSTATVTASSDLAAFPYTNVTSDFRYNQWVTEGNFVVVSTNKKIYFNDGSSRTATLTEASYTPAALATHIQTQMNAVSSNWTVTYSTTTYKFNFVNSSLNSTFTITTTTDAAWDMLGFTGGVDISKTSTNSYVPDEIRCHTEEYLIVDLAAATQIDFVALIGPLNEQFCLSSSATVTLYGNGTNTWTSPSFTMSLSVDSGGAMQFLDSNSSREYRYWKLKIVDRQNTAGPNGFIFGHFYLGAYDTLTTTSVERGFNVTQQDPSIMMVSENGARFFNRRTNYLDFSNVQISNPLASERRTLQQTFYDLGITTPFYVSLDPALEVSTEYQELTRYVTFTKPPLFNHVFSDYYNVILDFTEAN